MSGFKISTGADLDTLFATRVASDPSAQFIGYNTTDGKSLSERYLPYTPGNTKAIATGLNVTDASGNSQDINNYYSKIPYWTTLGTGPSNGVGSSITSIFALDASTVYVAGNFSTAGGSNSIKSIGLWNGITRTWSEIGTSSSFNTGRIVVATSRNNVIAVLSGIASTQQIQRYNGSTWSNMTAGITGSEVHSLFALNANDIYAGGDFTTPFRRIAKWNGTSWVGLTPGGAGGRVRTIYAFDTSTVYIGGDFTNVGDINGRNRIALWTGNAWTSVSSQGINGSVYTIHAFNKSNIYVGGFFSSAGGVACSNIAKWNGNNFTALGSGTNGTVNTIYALNDSNIYVGGDFTSAGGVANTRSLAKWDGVQWTALGTGILANVYSIYALRSNNIYIGGYFGSSFSGDVSFNNIVQWA